MAFLDRSCEELRSGGDLTEPMNRLSDGLWWFRRQSNRAEWMNWVETSALRHPIRELVHSDPFTHRSFAKPRGFAGDAGLLDLIYYDQGWVNLRGHTPVGQKIFWRNRNAPAPRAVRERRDHCAALVDRAALRKNGARVLAVACGNLREALQSSAVITRSLGEFVALDQDELALESVRATLGDRVVCRKGSVRTIVAGGLKEERFDLIYAAGLYDYLAKPLACRLTSKLFELLDPGGELLVANFTHDVADVGYMESFMAWHLIYRSPDELFDVASELPEAVRSTSVTYQLESPDIAYLRLMKT
jgi:hypothetical protein